MINFLCQIKILLLNMLRFQVFLDFFSKFLKFQVFLPKFQIPGFSMFPGKVATLEVYLYKIKGFV